MRLFPTRAELVRRGGRVLVLGVLLVGGKALWMLGFARSGERADLFARRAWLVQRVLADRAGVADMPGWIGERFRGEWAIGTYSMLVAALTNLSQLYPETRAENLPLIEGLIEGAMAAPLRAFDTSAWGGDALATLETGQGHAGYLGHLAFMLGAHRFAGGDARYEAKLEGVCAALARRVELAGASAHCIETYPGERYVMDNVVVMAALANADRVLGRRVGGAAVKRWLEQARGPLLDPGTGLLAFEVGLRGERLQGGRGSGAGWDSFYLPFVDAGLAAAQWAEVEKRMVARRLGFTGVLEFPPGVDGAADVDSGPVILGLSMSGTGFAVAGARHAGNGALVRELLWTAELAGCTVQWDGRRRYLFAPLVGEAIMLAMKSATPWRPVVPSSR